MSASWVEDSNEYKLISNFYGDKVANRSQVRLMNHIDEGLVVLDSISASEDTMKAFCIHPMIQNDSDLKQNAGLIAHYCKPYVVMLAMEYRSVANEFLSDKVSPNLPIDAIRLSPLWEVNDMLVADKVQNYKDFITYHKGSHARSKELECYFEKWLAVLKVRESFDSFCMAIEDSKK